MAPHRRWQAGAKHYAKIRKTMSRIGKRPITIPEGVKVSEEDKIFKVVGPKGELALKVPQNISIKIDGKEIGVTAANPDEKKNRAMWGTFARLISNMVFGVKEGYSKSLELVGIGFKMAVSGDEINMELGYSHPIKYKLPKGITAAVAKNILTISGIDKALVGDVAASIRKLRKPEPYKGKGIKYVDEVIRRKAGKAAKTTAA